MVKYLKEVKDLATRFAWLGQLQSTGDANDRILSGLGNEWEPLILALAPSVSTSKTDDLSSLLLNQDAKCPIGGPKPLHLFPACKEHPL